MKIQTKELQNILSVITNIVKYNNIKPITNLVELYAEDNICHIGATDNITKIVATVKVQEDLDKCILNLQELFKLVKLTTVETMNIKVLGDCVEIKGNGKYKIPIQKDEVGNELNLPLVLVKHTKKKYYNKENVDNLIKYNKIAVCKEPKYDMLCKYYDTGEYTITSDSIIIAGSKYRLPAKELNANVMDKLEKLPYDIIVYSINNGIFRVTNESDDTQYNMHINMDKTADFPIDKVSGVLDIDYSTIIREVDTKELLAIIKRLNIFTSVFNTPSVWFNDDIVYNERHNVEEHIDGVVEQKGDVKILLKIDTLLNVLKNMEQKISIYLNDNMIKLEDSNAFYIIGKMEEN